MAGVIVGAVAGGVLLAALGFFLFRRRRKLGEESHPMLPQQAYAGAIPGPRESSAYYSSPPGTGGWPKKDWGPSPDMRSSGFNWESPAHLSYPGGPLAPSPPLPPQELDSVQHFPTGSAQAPAEISGTPIATAAPASMQFQPYNPGQRQPGVG
jgi:LPXTG-motif cell wall-anchored protein